MGIDTFADRVALAQSVRGWPVTGVRFLRHMSALWQAGKIGREELDFITMIVTL